MRKVLSALLVAAMVCAPANAQFLKNLGNALGGKTSSQSSQQSQQKQEPQKAQQKQSSKIYYVSNAGGARADGLSRGCTLTEREGVGRRILIVEVHRLRTIVDAKPTCIGDILVVRRYVPDFLI